MTRCSPTPNETTPHTVSHSHFGSTPIVRRTPRCRQQSLLSCVARLRMPWLVRPGTASDLSVSCLPACRIRPLSSQGDNIESTRSCCVIARVLLRQQGRQGRGKATSPLTPGMSGPRDIASVCSASHAKLSSPLKVDDTEVGRDRPLTLPYFVQPAALTQDMPSWHAGSDLHVYEVIEPSLPPAVGSAAA
jgi:hypothetical protein